MSNPDASDHHERLHDADRFAFVPRRIHSFATSGNAYDATQCDEAIKSGDTLLVLAEGVVGIAYTWPFAVTGNTGNLHGIRPEPGDTLASLAKKFFLAEADLLDACHLANSLLFALDPALAGLIAGTIAPKGIA